MKKWTLGLAVLLLLGFTGNAQAAQASGSNPVSNALRGLVAREAPNVVGAVEEMPANKFSYHPTPAQWTFGHLVVHIIGANYGMCSSIGAVPRPKAAQVKDTDPKDKLVPALKASFQFCTEALKNVKDSSLSEEIPFFGMRKMTRGAMMITMAQDYGDHYSQAASYLRLNGLLPPTAQHKRRM
ncbi:MAG: DinB family protein [Candidatus Acidiferrales bacterium]